MRKRETWRRELRNTEGAERDGTAMVRYCRTYAHQTPSEIGGMPRTLAARPWDTSGRSDLYFSSSCRIGHLAFQNGLTALAATVPP